MSKLRIELNSAGVRELLKSPEMSAIVGEHASRIAQNCGDGYAHDVKQMPGRVIASAYTDSAEAYDDNLHNNTILRALQ